MAKKPGWKASQEKRQKKARIRQNGMYIDLASMVMAWRMGRIDNPKPDESRGLYPPTRMIVDYLNRRGWKAERGGPVDSRAVDEMLLHMDPHLKALPTADEERAALAEGRIIPGTEICGFAFDPESWMEFRERRLAGWEPSWRKHTIRADEAGNRNDGSQNLTDE